MASVLQALMGYDTSTQTASPEAVLRIINAYLAMAEVQARNSLHLHLLCWAKNTPSLHDIKEALANHPGTIAALSDYIGTLCKSSCSIDDRELKCTICGSKDISLLPAENVPRPSRPLLPSEAAPHFIVCNDCSVNLDAEEVLVASALDALRERAAAGVALAATLLSSYQACKESFLARPGPPPDADGVTVKAAMMLRALACQSHDPRHRKTCFKSAGVMLSCRFRLPRGAVVTTGLYRVNEDGSFSIIDATMDPQSVTNVLVKTYRDRASALINNFCPFITMALGCNNDIRVMIAADSSSVSYYTSKYTG